MDSMDLERERGITITSKPTSLSYKGVRINLVDTPGHADFGGEVERVLNMVDAVMVVVDAFEGPMPQTRFVTEKAVARGLKILLVVNKIDRPGGEPHKTVDAVFDLLASLGASDEQMDFPVIFCSARERYAMMDPADERKDMTAILDWVIQCAPGPEITDGPLAMWVSTLDYDSFLGYVAIGRIQSGVIKVGERLALVRPARGGASANSPASTVAEVFRVRKLLGFQGLRRFERESADAGDIVALSGMETRCKSATRSPTRGPVERRTHVPLAVDVDPPTHLGPVPRQRRPVRRQRGQVGDLAQAVRATRFVRLAPTSRSRSRTPSSPRSSRSPGAASCTSSVLMETMRREGYEFCVSRPRVILRENEDGKIRRAVREPRGPVRERIRRRGHREARPPHAPRCRRSWTICRRPAGPSSSFYGSPTRGLIGYRSRVHDRHPRDRDHGLGVRRLRPAPRHLAQVASARRADRDGDRRDDDLLARAPAGARRAVRRSAGRRPTPG
jgi:GTP-binding protein